MFYTFIVYCFYHCKTFSEAPDPTQCTKSFVTEECSTLFSLLKIKIAPQKKTLVPED